MLDQGYTGLYGNMMAYIQGIGAACGMPAGTNNQNAFIAGLQGTYLTGAAQSTLPRRAVAAYSNLSSVGSDKQRPTVPGATAWPARIGPALAFFPNRFGKPNAPTRPY